MNLCASNFDSFDASGFDGFIDSGFDARGLSEGVPIMLGLQDATTGDARLVRIDSLDGSIRYDVTHAGRLFANMTVTPLGVVNCRNISGYSGGAFEKKLSLYSYVDGSLRAEVDRTFSYTGGADGSGLSMDVAGIGDELYMWAGGVSTIYKMDSGFNILAQSDVGTRGDLGSGVWGTSLHGDGRIRVNYGIAASLRLIDPATLAATGTVSVFEDVGTYWTEPHDVGCFSGGAGWLYVVIGNGGGAYRQSVVGDRAPGSANTRSSCMGVLDEFWNLGGAYSYGTSPAGGSADRAWTYPSWNSLFGFSVSPRGVRRHPDGRVILFAQAPTAPYSVSVAKFNVQLPASVGGEAVLAKVWQTAIAGATMSSTFVPAFVAVAGGGVNDYGDVKGSGAWDDVVY
ncbi:MAG: hypothetical protein IT445_03030 [Phycisphaeraceae bacterium]|nr:hypothetical protein [Phycisphaeraceae bacterium]